MVSLRLRLALVAEGLSGPSPSDAPPAEAGKALNAISRSSVEPLGHVDLAPLTSSSPPLGSVYPRGDETLYLLDGEEQVPEVPHGLD